MVWSKQEILLLKENFPRSPDKNVAKLIGKSPNALRIKASRLKLNKEITSYRHNLTLNELEEQVVLGGLLGDLYCGYSKTALYPRLQGAHCLSQKEYALWKVNLLNRLKFRTRLTKTNYLWYESKSLKVLGNYYNLFYPNNKKVVTEDILAKLNDFGLLIWYLDDGSFNQKSRNITLYTNCFTYDEQILIIGWFKNKYNVKAKISIVRHPQYPNKVWYCLRFNVLDTKIILEKFSSFEIPNCMKYKLGLTKENSHSTSLNERNELMLVSG